MKRKDPAAVLLGRRGGKKGGAKGGKIRAERLSPERRSQIARKAAEVRWGRKEPDREMRELPHGANRDLGK